MSPLMQLTSKEKFYAHWIAQASWAGARIVSEQMTPDATKLLDLLLLTFRDKHGTYSDLSRLRSASGVSEEAWNAATTYAAQALTNLCNYKSFGHSKFIPRCSAGDFEAIIKSSPNANKALPLWSEVGRLADHCSHSSRL